MPRGKGLKGANRLVDQIVKKRFENTVCVKKSKKKNEPFQLPGRVGQCPVSNRRLVRMLKTTRTRLHWRWMRVRFSSLKMCLDSLTLLAREFYSLLTLATKKRMARIVDDSSIHIQRMEDAHRNDISTCIPKVNQNLITSAKLNFVFWGVELSFFFFLHKSKFLRTPPHLQYKYNGHRG